MDSMPRIYSVESGPFYGKLISVIREVDDYWQVFFSDPDRRFPPVWQDIGVHFGDMVLDSSQLLDFLRRNKVRRLGTEEALASQHLFSDLG